MNTRVEASRVVSYQLRTAFDEREETLMNTGLVVVKAARDEEARVWFVESSDLPGLNLEADTLDALIEKLPGAVLDLVEEGALDGIVIVGGELPIELIAHAATRLRIPVAA